jgi:hypothetical protein
MAFPFVSTNRKLTSEKMKNFFSAEEIDFVLYQGEALHEILCMFMKNLSFGEAHFLSSRISFGNTNEIPLDEWRYI